MPWVPICEFCDETINRDDYVITQRVGINGGPATRDLDPEQSTFAHAACYEEDRAAKTAEAKAS
jgi:hypothetical protein